MSTDIFKELTNGVLTEPMDIGTKAYEDFKLLIRSKVSETPKNERIKIALLGLKYKMEDYLRLHEDLVPVGSFIKEYLALIERKQIDFAHYVEMEPSNLSKILKGQRRLTVEFASILEELSNIEAELWLRIQNKNEI